MKSPRYSSRSRARPHYSVQARACTDMKVPAFWVMGMLILSVCKQGLEHLIYDWNRALDVWTIKSKLRQIEFYKSKHWFEWGGTILKVVKNAQLTEDKGKLWGFFCCCCCCLFVFCREHVETKQTNYLIGCSLRSRLIWESLVCYLLLVVFKLCFLRFKCSDPVLGFSLLTQAARASPVCLIPFLFNYFNTYQN